MNSRRRNGIINLGLIVLSTILTYYAIEAGYRYWRYSELVDGLFAFYGVDKPFMEFDEKIGFRYKPNLVVHQSYFDDDNVKRMSNTIRTNNFGHISPRDDQLARRPDEFRIAVLGDSFTACTRNVDVPWPTVLEDRLNADENFKAAVGKSTIKVINFGMDGSAINQWPAVYRHEAARFKPDLVLVSFVFDDVLRRFKWRGLLERLPGDDYQAVMVSTSLPLELTNPDVIVADTIVIPSSAFENPQARRDIGRAVAKRKLRFVPWFSPRPELLGVLSNRLQLPTPSFLYPRIVYRWTSLREGDREKGLTLSVKALRWLKEAHPDLHVIHAPSWNELAAGKPDDLVAALIERTPKVGLTSMIGFMDKPADLAAAEKLFNLPWDGHFSAAGVNAYAKGVHGYLSKLVTGQARTPNREGQTG